MTDINFILLNLIKNNCSNEEICKRLNITNKELKRRIESLKYDGFNISKSYNYDGENNYVLNKNKLISEEIVIIHNKEHQNDFKALVVSDNHIGHIKDNMTYTEIMYEYCQKRDIRIIFHCGDLLNGTKQNRIGPQEQLQVLINEYPSDNNILTFFAFGNHEKDFLKHYGINLKSVIEKYRDDIIPLGYDESVIHINNVNDDIAISHKNKFSNQCALRLAGHSHRYKFVAHNYHPLIIAPTLSDFLHTNDFPGAIEIYLAAPDDNTRYLLATHLIINNSNKVKEVSKIEHTSHKKLVRK